MESLMELVAASFERHGIECKSAESNSIGPAVSQVLKPSKDPGFATVLAEHNYRQIVQGDPSP